MPIQVDGFLGVLLDVSVKAALLAGVAGALILVLRIRDANLQHRIWTAVLVAVLALPLLVNVMPSVRVPISRSLKPVPLGNRSLPSLVQPVPVPEQPTASTFVDDVPTTEPALGPNSTKDVVRTTTVVPPPADSKNWLPQLMLVGYLAGACWFVVRLIIGTWRARRLVNAGRSIELPSTCRQMVGTTAVRESSQIRVPLTVGWRQATILLPSDWLTWDDAMLAAVLSHEQEHVRRRDRWVALHAELNRAVYWFHPIAWFLRRRLSTLAEEACDDAVLASLGDPTGYARHLLTVAARLTVEKWRLGPIGVSMARTPRVEHRINAILDSSRPLTRRLSTGIALVIISVAAPLVLLAAGLTLSSENGAAAALIGPAPQLAVEPIVSSNTEAIDEFALISAGPIRELKSESGGRAFEFPISVPKGRKFGISFGERPIRVAGLTYSLREKESDGPSTASLRLQFTSNSTAKNRDDVLLSDDEWMEFRLKLPNCYPEEVTHIAGVPLNNVPRAERKLILIPPDSPLAKAATGIRLLLIVRKDQNPKTAADVEKIAPRGEMIVSLEPLEKPKAEPAARERLVKAWRQSDAEIGTLFVRYQHTIGMQNWFRPLDAEAVRKTVLVSAAHNLKPNYGASDADAVQSHRFVEEIFRSAMSDEFLKRMNGKPVRMAQSDFRMVGMKRLDIFGTRPGEQPTMIHLYDGELDLNYNLFNKQLDVQEAGRTGRALPMAIRGPDDFRTILQTQSFRVVDIEKMLAWASVNPLPGGKVVVSFNGTEIVANPSNGFVERFKLSRGNDTVEEIFQFGPKEFSGHVTFPRARLVCRYQAGQLYMVQVVTNDELRVNEGFNDSDFTMKLPAGARIVDYRLDEFRPDVKLVDAEIADAVAYAKTHLPVIREYRQRSAPSVKGESPKTLAPIPIATPGIPSK